MNRNSQGAAVTIIGGGLAGTEAAWQVAQRGLAVRLFEMRPGVMTPAHHTGLLAELVCSNSLKGTSPDSAAGMLKAELEALGSIILSVAKESAVAAGGALAVDRERFSETLTRMIDAHPMIDLVRDEVLELPDGDCIVATGPLTSDSLAHALSTVLGDDRLAFFDAAAPIVEAASLNEDVIFRESRYGKGEGADYLNAPLDKPAYDRLIDELVEAKRVIAKDFEHSELFHACQPVEQVARSGRDALRFGALKPVGLTDPRTGERPYAVVQLRAENAAGSAYNLVGFQTNLTFSEQRRVFSQIPGLENAEFVRYGVMHRNTFIDSPRLLDSTLAVRTHPRIRVCGQLAGTEGYLEAAASGLLAGLNSWAAHAGAPYIVLPPTSAFGALMQYATDPATEKYQPMHVNFGLMPALDPPVRKKRERYEAYARRGAADLTAYIRSRSDVFAGRL